MKERKSFEFKTANEIGIAWCALYVPKDNLLLWKEFNIMIFKIFFIRRNESFLGADGISAQARSLALGESTSAAEVQKVSFIFKGLCVFTG